MTTAVGLLSGNDTLTIGSGVVLRGLRPGDVESFGLIDCGEDFDTLVFAMDVPESQLELISLRLANEDPADGSITINGLFYIWKDCEQILNELVGVRNFRPIPTLSEWGLIAMAGVLGIIGLLAIRRRKVTA